MHSCVAVSTTVLPTFYSRLGFVRGSQSAGLNRGVSVWRERNKCSLFETETELRGCSKAQWMINKDYCELRYTQRLCVPGWKHEPGNEHHQSPFESKTIFFANFLTAILMQRNISVNNLHIIRLFFELIFSNLCVIVFTVSDTIDNLSIRWLEVVQRQ